jgi:hypothetical protein
VVAGGPAHSPGGPRGPDRHHLLDRRLLDRRLPAAGAAVSGLDLDALVAVDVHVHVHAD